MTHRVFSKNAASSRAIPIEKMIDQVFENPAKPVWWGKNQSGMQAKEELDEYGKSEAMRIWLQARADAISHAHALSKIGAHKQIANRLLEPWFNIRVILTGTDFGNFFALRAHPDTQPEFQALAYKMLEAYNASTPKEIIAGQWHIPFGDKMDDERIRLLSEKIQTPENEVKLMIAVARCARVSYFNFEGKDDYEKDAQTAVKLFGSVPRHLSPTEHVAMCVDQNIQIGNFFGWKQYRKFFDDENLDDSRICKK
jgi:thymidylate synthase ThyX